MPGIASAVHGSWRVANEDGRRRGSGQAFAFLVDRPGRDRVRSGDQVARLLESRPRRRSTSRSCRNILELHTSQNTGALWGFGATIPGSSLIFAGLSVVAAVVDPLLSLRLWVPPRTGSLTVALGLIMAGAMGNCYDRLVFGHVRDFVHFHVDAIGFDCAIFNFADNMLVAGAITLVLYALRPEKASQEQAPSDEQAERRVVDRLT